MAANPRSSAYRMADRLAQGRLAVLLSERVTAGESYDAIAKDLYATYGIDVNARTIQTWARQLGLVAA